MIIINEEKHRIKLKIKKKTNKLTKRQRYEVKVSTRNHKKKIQDTNMQSKK